MHCVPVHYQQICDGQSNYMYMHSTSCALLAEIIVMLLNTGNKIIYRIAGKFGGELNLAVWRSILQLPKFPNCIHTNGDPIPNHQI